MSGVPIRQLKLRRDILANIPLLAEGEPWYATDTKDLYIGTSTGNKKLDDSYAPAIPANWAGTPPATIHSALDRLAAAVEGLLGVPIP